MNLTNLTNIDLSLAVWLVSSDYDFIPERNTISATGLLKPTRQILLGQRMGQMVRASEIEEPSTDLSELISSRLGDAIHDSVEHAWLSNYRQALKLLGYPAKAIDMVRINPAEPEPGTIPIYTEVRGSRSLDQYTVSGKLDLCIDGRLKDIKSTSVWTYILGRKDDDYILQGSIYKWIHRDKVTADEIDIQFVFTDWKAADQKQNPDYPQNRVLSYTLPLLTEAETETWIRQKIQEVEKYRDAPDQAIPRCTDEELWRKPATWKYYADPHKTQRATKNFDNPQAANQHLAQAGKGVVKFVPGEVRACNYCRAAPICQQRLEYA
jgi:hypothetical protein